MSSSSGVAEIEVVVADGGSRKGEGEQKQPSGAEPDPVVDVYSAAAYGDLERLRQSVEREGGAGSLSAPDGNGYHALQWAALNNYPNVALYIIEHGGDVNAEDHAQQTALHWAAVRGATVVADVLLDNGARLEAADVNGYRAVHVAAQYGQTTFLHHIVSKYGADFDALDNDGRSSLHWAAYKGNADTIRLLLFMDANQVWQDKNVLNRYGPGPLSLRPGADLEEEEHVRWQTSNAPVSAPPAPARGELPTENNMVSEQGATAAVLARRS